MIMAEACLKSGHRSVTALPVQRRECPKRMSKLK
jgi:hypothetical protein